MLFRAFFLIACLWSVEVRAEWHEASSKHFVVYSESHPDRLLEFATQLERFDKAIRVLRGLDDPALGPANRVTVFMTGGTGKIAKLAGDREVAGFYIPRAIGSVAFVPQRTSADSKFDLDATTILQHEYAHHLMFSAFSEATFPVWLIEGFAEFHATATMKRDGSMVIGSPPLYRAYGLLTGNPLPVAAMLSPLPEKMTPAQRDALYGRGWLLTHFVTFDEARRAQFKEYLLAINRGETLDQAKAAFGDLKQLQRDLDRYLSKRISAWSLKPELLPIGPVQIRKLGPGEAAMMEARILSKRGVNRETAPRVLEIARRAAAPFPNDPAAQVALAEAEFDAGNYAESDAAAARALVADPKSVDALIYRGMAQMAIAEAENSTEQERWRAIRRWFLQANKIDPIDPEPLMLFYRSFIIGGQQLTANAKAALIEAHMLAPQDDGLRAEAGMLMLRDGDAERARRTLRPLAYNPHGGELAQATSQLIELLDRDGAAAAVKHLDTLQAAQRADAEAKGSADGDS